ncbi:MAG TPA: DUF4287 domain-containing protein [Aggregatilineales bacterium]|nr:DUF4287 domain-containing protein [Aggregatilineales bacterium]
MTFQAYLDTIKAKTGKSPDDFKSLAAEKGLVEYREIFTWLKADFGLGHGHANAMAHVILDTFETKSKTPLDEQIARQFAGAKALWREPFESLMEKVRQFGPDVRLATTDSYISVLRADKKFAIVQVTAKRLDIGIKRKGVPAEGRFEESGKWNAMVTHRVKITAPDQIDEALTTWLQQAYENA